MIYDFLGKEIKEFEPQEKIDLSDLSIGLYLVKLYSETKIITYKIMKK
jgi:Secretion system C-terminal sorting domain